MTPEIQCTEILLHADAAKTPRLREIIAIFNSTQKTIFPLLNLQKEILSDEEMPEKENQKQVLALDAKIEVLWVNCLAEMEKVLKE